jgi:hypothetical protein
MSHKKSRDVSVIIPRDRTQTQKSFIAVGLTFTILAGLVFADSIDQLIPQLANAQDEQFVKGEENSNEDEDETILT